MENTTLFVVLGVIVALVVGGYIGYNLIPPKIETQILTQEVVKEVPVEIEVIKNVPLDVKATYLTPALEDFIKEASDDDDFVYCKGEEFDEDQVKIKSTPKDWKVEINKDETTVSFDVKMKYLDKDVEEKCYAEYAVEVLYEDDEDPQVKFSLI